MTLCATVHFLSSFSFVLSISAVDRLMKYGTTKRKNNAVFLKIMAVRRQLAFSWTTEVDWKSAFWSQLKTFVNKRSQLKVYKVSFKWLKTTTVDPSESPQVDWNQLKPTETYSSRLNRFSRLESVSVGWSRFQSTWGDSLGLIMVVFK